MPKYLFTSDLRISELPERIKKIADFVCNGGVLSNILDKSDNNNATTLAFYFCLQKGTEICKKAAQNPKEAIRNFTLKFQFPNTRTSESLRDSLTEGLFFAPYRFAAKLLFIMATTGNGSSFLSLDEILYYGFLDNNICKNPLYDSKDLVQQINSNRLENRDLSLLIKNRLSWNQYGRQCREMFTVLTYASDCFKLKNGFLNFSLKSEAFVSDESFINKLVDYNQFWLPTNQADFNLASQEYISYMDTNTTPFQVVDFQKLPQFHKEKVTDIDSPLQQIFYGAPGTGKSHTIKLETAGRSVIRTTFHPDSDYSTFVGAYKPVMGDVDVRVVPVVVNNGISLDQNNGTYKERRITYKFVMQAFTKAYLAAWKKYAECSDESTCSPQFLVIEEINRGNCAQIFGDLFQLLDRSGNGFSTYPIEADADLKNIIEESFKEGDYKLNQDINCEGAVENYTSNYGDTLSHDIQAGRVLLLPPNLYIWATMNTSDQSLFPIDSAFKRRWDWRYVPITQAYKKDQNDNYETDSDGQKIPLGWKIRLKIKDQEKDYDWWEFVQAINRIVYDMTSSADKQLGYFFCQAGDDGIISADKFVNKVAFYLWNDVFKDYGFDDYASIFKFKTIVDEKEVTKDLTFPDFFDPDADTVNNDVAMQFVDNVLAWNSSDDKKNDNG